ncbi:MAG: hypothetical protein ACFFFK_10025 [Candidatus Thorarchaeota archaeon]
MDRVKWRKPINRLMAIFFVFAIVSFIPGLADPVKLLLLPAIVGLGYFFESEFVHNHLQANQPLVRPRSLLIPIGATIFALLFDAWDNRSFFEVTAEPMFWVAMSIFYFLWILGSTVYRYLYLGFAYESVD